MERKRTARNMRLRWNYNLLTCYSTLSIPLSGVQSVGALCEKRQSSPKNPSYFFVCQSSRCTLTNWTTGREHLSSLEDSQFRCCYWRSFQIPISNYIFVLCLCSRHAGCVARGHSMTHYSACTCSDIRTMKLRFLTKKRENLLAERLFVNIHREHWTINLFSEFLFFLIHLI